LASSLLLCPAGSNLLQAILEILDAMTHGVSSAPEEQSKIHIILEKHHMALAIHANNLGANLADLESFWDTVGPKETAIFISKKLICDNPALHLGTAGARHLRAC
jgi:hypothetical protein